MLNCLNIRFAGARGRGPRLFDMRPPRAAAVALMLAAGLATAVAPGKAAAEDASGYPSRPITFVVPSPAGGTSDVIARLAARKLSDKLGQSIIVENRAGANGYIGTMAVLRAPKDGYMYAVMSGSLHSFTPAMVNKMPFDPIDDFALVSRLAEYPYILVTSKNSPYNTLADLIKAGKDGKTELSYGSYGLGSSPHLITELLKLKTGMAATHIPYKGGGQSSGDLIGGQISFMFSSLPAATAQVKGGQAKALAITSAQRNPSFPNVPTVAETLPGFETTSWLGLGAAKGTPAYATDKIRNALIAISKDPEYITAMRGMSAEVKVDASAAEFHQYMASELAKWNEVVKEAKIPKQEE
ncbi:Bug family tripartite tricarboxylate transporter substrate binding protein [Bordetella sp. H567]|uniref:Bug family tripartite tricarboxylate transporter substrate binding protein n=1 Tax=Bordetella sp. H567 TaxID=1697043 RepID=UPI000AF1F947|nr:tripartite tricarboxylate transporter substrate binding protein [Bordetella sp. H567]